MKRHLLLPLRATLVAFVLALLASTVGPIAVAHANTSDSALPYTVSAEGVTLPAGSVFPADGHVNYKATALDGSSEQTFNMHFDPNNNQPGGQFVGQQFFGFKNYPGITISASSAFPAGYCITWVQVSLFNQHFGEGGQKPACTGTPQTTNKKVYVCKYVGTPGVDERLQTGQNPIEVSVNAIQNNQWNGNIPGWFSDAHDRSYVLGYVPMNPEPTAASCPQPSNPPACVSTIDMNDVKAYYTTDPFNAKVEYTGKALCDGATKTVSLNSYATDGPTWPTSGNQVFVDHDQVTISKDKTSGDLKVQAPACYYQTDLYWGSMRYDGVDGPLPQFPHTPVPDGLIDHRNGGTACPEPPKKVEPADVTPVYPTCAAPNKAGFTIMQTEGITYEYTIGATTTTAQNGFNSAPLPSTVTVTAKAKSGYELKAGSQTTWQFTYVPLADNACDVCPNIPGDQTTVPQGYVIDQVDGNCYEPGGRGGEEPEDTPLTITTISSSTPTPPAQLANTGSTDTIIVTALGVLSMVVALISTISVRRQPSAQIGVQYVHGAHSYGTRSLAVTYAQRVLASKIQGIGRAQAEVCAHYSRKLRRLLAILSELESNIAAQRYLLSRGNRLQVLQSLSGYP